MCTDGYEGKGVLPTPPARLRTPIGPGGEPSSDGGPVTAWILGYGAGTAGQPLAAGASALGVDLEVTGLELDPVVEELAAEWMPLPARDGVSVRAIGGADARARRRGEWPRRDPIAQKAVSGAIQRR